MRRLLALMAVVALVVAFALPMVGTAEAASHGDKAMNPCDAKAKAKEMQNANPCGKAANPCGKATAEETMKKGKKTMKKGEQMMEKGEKKMMDKTKSQ